MTTSRQLLTAQMLLIAAAAVVIYGRSLDGPFIFDDFAAIVDNPHIRQLWPLHWSMAAPHQSAVAGRPIVSFSLAVNYAIGELDPRGYHAFNLVLHVLCAWLLLVIVRRTFDRCDLSISGSWLAFGVVLIWTVHPLQTEAVIYTTQRTELMVSLFFLLMLYGFIRGCASPRRLSWFTLAVASCALGMATKEVMVTGPLLILMYDRTFVSRTFVGALRRHRWFYLALTSSWIVLALIVMVQPRSQSVGLSHGIGSLSYFLTQCGVVLRYLSWCAWPTGLSIRHEWPIATGFASVPALLGLLALGGLTAWLTWRNTQVGFCGAWFFLILAPTSSFVPIVSEIVAERRMYLPLAGVLTVGAIGVWKLTQSSREHPARWELAVIVGLIAGFWAIFSWVSADRLRDYRSERAIWEAVLEIHDDQSSWAHNALGRIAFKQNRLKDAETMYERALVLDPNYARARVNLAVIHLHEGQLEAAESELRAALEDDPLLIPAYVNFGILLVRQDRVNEAIACYHQALQRNLESPIIYNNLGAAFQKLGQWKLAATSFREAIGIDPYFVEARWNLARALETLELDEAAITAYRAILRLQPDASELHKRLGTLLAREGRYREAIPHFHVVLSTQPQNVAIRKRLAVCLFRTGDYKVAIRQLELVLDRAPTDADAHRRLAKMLRAAGQRDRARRHLEESLLLEPEKGTMGP